MANWSEAFKTLGEGLGRMGVVQLQKEENRLENMRKEALEKLRMAHDEKMQGKRLAQAEDLFQRGEESATQREARGAAYRASESAADRQARKEETSAIIAAGDRRSRDQALADVDASTRRQLAAVAQQRADLEKSFLEIANDPARLDAMTDEQKADYQRAFKRLDQQAAIIARSGADQMDRIRSGQAFQGKELSADEVKNLTSVGAKGPTKENAALLDVTGGSATPETGSAPAAPAAQVQQPAPQQAAAAPQQSRGGVFAPILQTNEQLGLKPGTAGINSAIGEKLRGVFTDPSSPTGNINKQLFDLFQ